MNSSLLTDKQKLFLQVFGTSLLANNFYLTGGTALAAYYIPYRFSEDLDFFSEKEVDIETVQSFLASAKQTLGFDKTEFNTSFNRNLIFLKWSDQELKLEFTFFPFPQIENPRKEIVRVDSLTDIAVNKAFTIYQKPRSRDFMDLYMIHKYKNFAFSELIRKARIKFDTHIDPIKLGSQLLLAKTLKDYPKLVHPLNERDWQGYFIKEAKKMKRSILA